MQKIKITPNASAKLNVYSFDFLFNRYNDMRHLKIDLKLIKNNYYTIIISNKKFLEKMMNIIISMQQVK